MPTWRRWAPRWLDLGHRASRTCALPLSFVTESTLTCTTVNDEEMCRYLALCNLDAAADMCYALHTSMYCDGS
jgi:hypothetical protein